MIELIQTESDLDSERHKNKVSSPITTIVNNSNDPKRCFEILDGLLLNDFEWTFETTPKSVQL